MRCVGAWKRWRTPAMREPIACAISRLTERGAIETSGVHLRMVGL